MVSPHVKAALQTYADTLKASYSAVGVSAGAEEQLKAPTKTLLETCAELAPKTVKNRPARVVALLETSVKGTGRPDVGVTLDGLLNGYVELKAPDKPADPTKFKDKHDKEQWKKFQLFPNVIYTNGLEWRLYRYDGEKPVLTASVKLGDYIKGGASAVTDDEAAKFSAFLQTFYTWKVITPTTPQGLAALLAPLAKLFRQEVAEALKIKGSKIENVRDIWKSTLFPRATDEQFADIYAQTVTYALLLAKLDGANVLDSSSAVKTLKKGHELLSSALKILTDDDLKEELGSGLETLLRVINDLDAAVFKKQEEKLWLYFYEYFLEAYDRELRNKYGVYYTPVQVIGAQVRLVDEVLKTRLGKAQGFADKSVLLLDPAAGTGAYPLAVIQHALGEAESYGAGMVAQVATDLASTTHAFEILVGPYAVSHLRISQAVQNAGGTLPADGAHVYLNDTLESPHATNPAGLPFMLQALTDEHKRAQKVKLETPIMVTLGNPPYDRHDAKDTTRGGWVRHKQDSTGGILEDFLKPVRDAGEGGHIKNLYNDYVYFWRWALWKTFENPGTDEQPQPVPRPGIVCFITAASYLRGPGFMGMREMMRRTFSELWILDLEGDNLGARKTENVFAIQTPVCIALGVKLEGNDPNTPATVRYAKITGTREEKLAELDKITKLADVNWRETMSGWDEPFLPTGDGDYWKWPKLTDVFPARFNGLQYKRTWPIAETRELLGKRWDELKIAPVSKKPGLFKESRDRKTGNTYPDLITPTKRLSPLSSLPATAPLPRQERYAYRSFDRQWALIDNRVGDYLRPDLWRSHGPQQVYMVGMLTGLYGEGVAAVATPSVPDLHYFAGRGGKDVIPLYLDAEGTKPNVTPGLLDVLAAQYGAAVSGEELFAYAYALLSTPAYVELHSEDLTVPGPRLPITKDAALFAEGAKLGREMLNLHTYGERFAAAGSAGAYRGKARNTKAMPTTADKYPDDYSYNMATQTLKVGEGEFSPVPSEVFTYSVSGLEVLQSWIKYRLKKGYGRRSSPLDDLRPEVWTAELTRELLELIWLLERTLELEPAHTDLLKRVEAGECFQADELPQPVKHDDDEEDGVEEDKGMDRLF
ncbi:hypothetical protein Dxin01_04246 [Deinococcus xinjiangensis]|uniref:site-specific DNA-methyltransferase (adenine-specific) n=2 Tax=Deinococcus xinjiangensis TaxID=457454 RepID=A0ABP9VLB4_9DEIO